MMEYIGMARLTEDELASEKTFNATSPEECKKKCNQFGDYHCLYNSSANHADSCVETNRNVKDLPVEFNLTFVGNETISYVKSQINKVVQITIDVPEVDYNDTDLPCYIERVPTTSPLPTTNTLPATTTVIYDETSTMTVDPDEATFPFINSEQLEQIVDEIKEENTIDIKTLSSYRNKLMCAQDNRPSAKAIGYAGAIFIGLLLGLILLLDVPKIIMDLTSLYRLEMEHCVMDDEEHLLEGSQRRSILHFRRYSF
ncbi:uncharacterized protein [Argopecten irradians]|uniref:uncharacterized protein n=1 Tax=Argopecten irradians TaxID=31199 RepID=UPI00371D581C